MTADRRSKTGAELKDEVLQKIETFTEENRATARRMHELFMEANPNLQPRLWYGMPGYAKTKDSAVLCFFREDEYMTFGLSESAHFDQTTEGDLLLPSAWFFTTLNTETEQHILQIIRSATQ